jgi:hypothetical protein
VNLLLLCNEFVRDGFLPRNFLKKGISTFWKFTDYETESYVRIAYDSLFFIPFSLLLRLTLRKAFSI